MERAAPHQAAMISVLCSVKLQPVLLVWSLSSHRVQFIQSVLEFLPLWTMTELLQLLQVMVGSECKYISLLFFSSIKPFRFPSYHYFFQFNFSSFPAVKRKIPSLILTFLIFSVHSVDSGFTKTDLVFCQERTVPFRLQLQSRNRQWSPAKPRTVTQKLQVSCSFLSLHVSVSGSLSYGVGLVAGKPPQAKAADAKPATKPAAKPQESSSESSGN